MAEETQTRKILISALGVGPSKEKKAAREYKQATYRIKGEDYESSFIAAALYDKFQIDDIIFIGTVKSMWEAVYDFFCKKNSIKLDDKYFYYLIDEIDTVKYDSPLDSLDLSPINKILGNNSRCVLTKYGLDETELWENFENIITALNETLKNKNETYEIHIDITHSFRSIAMFMFLVMTFIKELPDRKVGIKSVYYGMFEASGDLKYTPVVDLKPLLNLTEWVKGAYILQKFGDGDLISKLLKEEEEIHLSGKIKNLSNAINLNYLTAIKECSGDLYSSLQQRNSKNLPNKPFKYLKKDLEEFAEKFGNEEDNESDFQLKFARWSFENNRYAAGYITLTEAIVTYVCEVKNFNSNLEGDRKKIKNLLHKDGYKKTDIAKLFFKVNEIRVSIAHALIEDEIPNYQWAISDAEKYLKEVEEIFATDTLDV